MPFKSMVPTGSFQSWASPNDPERPSLQEVPQPDRAPTSMEELQTLLDEAKEEGAEEAKAEVGVELAQLREVIETLEPALKELEALRHGTLVRAAEDIADVVKLFASRVVGDALAIHPDALPRLVRDAIDQLPEREQVTIEVSPAASEKLSRTLPQELRDRIVVMPEITAGAVVRTRNASLDATLKTAEQALESAVQEWLAEQWWVDGDHS